MDPSRLWVQPGNIKLIQLLFMSLKPEEKAMISDY